MDSAKILLGVAKMVWCKSAISWSFFYNGLCAIAIKRQIRAKKFMVWSVALEGILSGGQVWWPLDGAVAVHELRCVWEQWEQ